MPLNSTSLGQDLYNAEKQFNNLTIKQVGDMEAYRLKFWTTMAQVIITHFQENAQPQIPGAGLVAPTSGGPVTGESITGKIF